MNQPKIFNFKSQLQVGNNGEADFLNYYQPLAPSKADDRAFDFVINEGEKVELKSDSYSMEDTENFFMETVSDINSGKIGGPHRALRDKVDHFVYYFLKNKTFFWFKTEPLCQRLDELIASKQFKPKKIKNRGWTGEGYALPRSAFEDIQVKKDIFP